MSRNVRRAGRRLQKKEEDKDSFAMELETWVGEDTESYSFVKIDKIESCMRNLSLGQAEHQELYETLAVETAFMDLSIEEDQAEQWEMSEHCWLEKVELKEAIVPLPISKYFKFGEEQAEHHALDGLLTEMLHMNLGPETIVEFRLCCDNCVNCWETNRINYTSRRKCHITSSVCLNVPTNVTNFTTLTGASGATLHFSRDKDRLGKVTEFPSKQEQLEVVDRADKTILLTELASEHLHLELKNNITNLGNMKQYSNIIPTGSCSRPSGSEDEPEGQQRKQELEMVEMDRMGKPNVLTELADDPEESIAPVPVPGMTETVVEIKANEEQVVEIKANDEQVVEIKVNEEQGEARVSMIPRRGEVAVGIKTIIDNLKSKDEDCARARRVVIAGRGRTKRKREAGKLILSRIEDLFGNQVGGKQERGRQMGIKSVQTKGM